ncbi:hypothetical protein SAMN04487819_11477 [Actinopolyspora alba]|uniref:Uncharacterized protein n=1 Tax=Actinopolyspora alba TaxID=673379 RepID=A0A1I2AS68_9ACTN|nr:hypothetical protein [Actinopolyspora alba]SFE46577.1 hypothetical protein SAMN04487819_11477 [Actinopolyspora alba]
MIEPDSYLREFSSAARELRVKGKRIGELVAEIETHIEDTAEDPRETFGDPRKYAVMCSSDERLIPLPSYGRCFGSFLGFLLGVFLVLGALHRAVGGSVLQLGWAFLLPVGACVISASLLALAYRRDPRGAPLIFPALLAVATILQPHYSWGTGFAVPFPVAASVGLVLIVGSMVVFLLGLPRSGPIIDPGGDDRTSLGRPVLATVLGNTVIGGFLVAFALFNSWMAF